MSTKPLSELSPAYRRRIERSLAAGKTLQQARGHKIHEHVERRQKEKTRGQLTSDQKQQIKRYVIKHKTQIGIHDDDIRETVQEIIDWTEGDYSRFSLVRDTQKTLSKNYIKRGRSRGKRPMPVAVEVEAPIAYDFFVQVKFVEYAWMHYH
jgi:hypothetical protein